MERWAQCLQEPVPTREGWEEHFPLRVCHGDSLWHHENHKDKATVAGGWSEKYWIHPRGDKREN